MAEIRAAEVRDADGAIVNIIMRHTGRPVPARTGFSIIDDPEGKAEIGGTWDVLLQDFNPPPEPTDQRPLAEIKAAATIQVDHDAERARRLWITPGDGQALTYEAKRDEVLAWQAAQVPGSDPLSLSDVPWMVRRAARLNAVRIADVTLAQAEAVYTEWSARVAAWRAAGLDIEDVREQAKEDIAGAANADAVRAVLGAITWPAP